MIRQKLSTTAGVMLLLCLFIVVSTSDVCAQSARSRGMGGAFIGLSDDESATFYNPAGLSQIQGREASIQAKVNERDVFDWTSVAFTGHIYEDHVEDKFSITDYLEHNILEEPVPRRPKYSYGMAYTEDNRSEAFGQLVGGEYLRALGTKRACRRAERRSLLIVGHPREPALGCAPGAGKLPDEADGIVGCYRCSRHGESP